MQNKSNRKFIYAGGLPVVVLSSIVIWNSIHSDAYECYGMVEVFGYMFVGGLLIFLIAITLLVQIVRMFEKPEWFARILTLLVSLSFFSAAMYTMSQPRDYFKAEVILEATFHDRFDGSLLLHEDGMFSANEEHTDWSCTTYDTYHQIGDTILLSAEVAEKSHDLFSDRYLIVQNKFLIPIRKSVADIDSTSWLTIVKR